MKKIIIIALFLIGCDVEVKVKPQEVNAQSSIVVDYPKFGNERTIRLSYFKECGMRYAVIFTSHLAAYAGDGISVINITKDSLEVQLLKKKLSDTLVNTKTKKK